jgi:hypothetical protein
MRLHLLQWQLAEAYFYVACMDARLLADRDLLVMKT